jgi:hypothetical protein
VDTQASPKPPRGLRSRIRRWGPSWSARQRRIEGGQDRATDAKRSPPRGHSLDRFIHRHDHAKPPRGLRSRPGGSPCIRKGRLQRDRQQRRNSSRMRSLQFNGVHCHPRHSSACQGCKGRSLASYGDRRVLTSCTALRAHSATSGMHSLSPPARRHPGQVTSWSTNGL